MKKIVAFLGFAVIGAAIWYLFIKSHDYQVTFEVKTFPGEVNQLIKAWGNTQKDSKITDEKNISQLTQQLQFADSIHLYEWEITAIHDSLSQVRVYAKDKNNSLRNKLSIPFSDTDFQKRTRKTVLDFAKELNEHRKSFKVTVVGEAEIPSTFCVCSNLITRQIAKADGMMRDYPLLTDFLSKHAIPLNGPPFLEITQWKKGPDLIEFNFCFPIFQTKILPEHPELLYRKFRGNKALKATYNGNYSTSDRAWYALIDYAKKNNIEVTELPVEFFFNNPNMGGNALNWNAEIYLPLKADTDD